MNNNTAVVKYGKSRQMPSIVMAVFLLIFGGAGLVYNVLWLMPQTVSLPIEFPEETAFGFFNVALAAGCVMVLAALVMGLVILKGRKERRGLSCLRMLHLIGLIAFVVSVGLMIKSPLIYNVFLLAAIVPAGSVLFIYTCVNGLPLGKKEVTWTALMLGLLVALVPIMGLTGWTMYSYMDYANQNDKYVAATDFKNFKAECLDGTELDQNYFKGHKVTMVNCWETICGPCIREMPSLEEIYEEKNGPEFSVIGICANCTVGGKVDEAVVADAKEIVGSGIKYPVVVPSGELENGILNDITAFPTTFFVDSDGNVIKVVLGAKEKKEWEKIIAECCEMAGGR